MKSTRPVAALLSIVSIASATITKTCPATDICYSLNIPDSTAQSGNGDIYFQLSAPTSYSWVALGQGTSMPGANIFMIYSSADGQNVTLSPRLGTGFVMPQHDTSADVTLLAGSGISNGMMTANVKCSNCNSWNGGTMDFTSSSASWIYAYKSGSALDSDDPSEGIVKHDVADSFTWDLASAKGGSDVNPFVATSTSTGGSGSSSGSMPATVTQPATSGSGGGSDEQHRLDMIRTAHAFVAAVAFLIIFPFGAVLIRLGNFPGLIWVHAGVQLLAYAMFIAAVGMGLYVATTYDAVAHTHPIIGLVVFALLFFQPFSGLVHHQMWKKCARRTFSSWVHLSVGRVAIILGIANGFVGLHWADNASSAQRKAYLAVAVIALVVYISAIVYGEFTRAQRIRKNHALGNGSTDNIGKVETGAS